MNKTSGVVLMMGKFGGITPIPHLNLTIGLALSLNPQSSSVVSVQLNEAVIPAIVKNRKEFDSSTWIVKVHTETLWKATHVESYLEWSDLHQQWQVVIYTKLRNESPNGDYDRSSTKRIYPLK